MGRSVPGAYPAVQPFDSSAIMYCGNMDKSAKILDYAQSLGSAANRAEFVAQTSAGDIYALSLEDDNGFPLPTGLPRFVIFNEGKYKLVDGEAGLKLSRSLGLEE